MSARALNLWVFRESPRLLTGRRAKTALLHQLQNLSPHSSPDHLIAALLRAGELECGVADGAAVPLEPWMAITEGLAGALVSAGPLDTAVLAQCLQRAPVPDQISASPPEGFAYYALHPLAYSEIFSFLTGLSDSVAVIGIRSIGTTLSAMLAAAARARGKAAGRITVRPSGHPYNRFTIFSAPQIEFVRRYIESGSTFLVVDEGPGLSGSSLLSIAEALERAGVRSEQISLVCGHEPDFANFRADDGPQRAARFRWTPVRPEPRRPAAAGDFIGGGEWRRRLFDHSQPWPAAWTSVERLKYISEVSAAEKRFFKFLGLGHYGEEVFVREQQVAHAGFGPAPTRETNGFVSYPWLAGRPMTRGDLTQEVLDTLSDYCAFRAQAFPASDANLPVLQRMAGHNLEQQSIAISLELPLERPVIADGRMQPYEWLLTPKASMVKTDSGAHGDDHFFPGPTDIAWDLAGSIIEWGMNAEQSRYFLERYRYSSHDDASARIGDFIIAYTAFRTAWCRMAANALAGSAEQERLEMSADGYAAVLHQLAQGLLV